MQASVCVCVYMGASNDSVSWLNSVVDHRCVHSVRACVILISVLLYYCLWTDSRSSEVSRNSLQKNLKMNQQHVHAAARSHLHLQLFGGGGLQLGGNGALQRVSNQRQALAAVVGNGQHLTFHRLPVHPVTLQEGRAREGGVEGRTEHNSSSDECKGQRSGTVDSRSEK